MSKEIFIDCLDNGDVAVEASGFPGRTCATSTQPFIEALGMRNTKETPKEENQGTRQTSSSRSERTKTR